MMRQASVSLPAETAALMRRSVELSPAQINVILARFEVWRKMDLTEHGLAEAELTADLARLLSYGRRHDIEATKAWFSGPLVARASSVVLTLPEDKKVRLVGMGMNFFPVGPTDP